MLELIGNFESGKTEILAAIMENSNTTNESILTLSMDLLENLDNWRKNDFQTHYALNRNVNKLNKLVNEVQISSYDLNYRQELEEFLKELNNISSNQITTWKNYK
jgi:hypothetical protein